MDHMPRDHSETLLHDRCRNFAPDNCLRHPIDLCVLATGFFGFAHYRMAVELREKAHISLLTRSAVELLHQRHEHCPHNDWKIPLKPLCLDVCNHDRAPTIDLGKSMTKHRLHQAILGTKVILQTGGVALSR